MNYFSLDLLLYLFLFLFAIYALSKDDYLFLRKNVTLEQIFNIAILASLVSLVFARLFFVIFHFKTDYFNPLVLFLFPYFPGLSLAGAVVGGSLFLVSYCRAKKLPLGHIADIISLAFFSVIPVGFLLQIFVFQKKFSSTNTFVSIFSIIILIALFISYFKVKLKEGSNAALSLFSFSILYLLFDLFNNKNNMLSIKPEDVVVGGVLIISFFLLLKQEKIISFGRWGKKS